MPLSISHLLNRTAKVERQSTTVSGTGFVEGFTTIAAAEPCRRMPAGSVEQETAARMERNVTDVVWFGPDANVVREDRLTINARLYEVLSVNEPSDTLYVKALAEEIQQGQ